MSKKAFCVGINEYPYEGANLNGCVNDAHAWAALLTDHYDFPTTDVKVCLNEEATKSNIIAGLKTLLAGAQPGDVLVFTNSSHGTYIAEDNADEPQFDEALCPYDVEHDVLRDDVLRGLFSAIPKGVSMTVISDSCFSGTVTRALVGVPGMRTPDDRRLRFLSPAYRKGKVLPNPWRAKASSNKYPESGMKEVLLSGCSDNEYSYDALIEGVYHGAMTYHALSAIRNAQYKLTYSELHARTQVLIDEAQYNQHPQLEGRTENKQRQIFT